MNKTTKVLITGGSRGIGLGIAHALEEAGYEVIAVGKSKQAKFLKRRVRYIQADLSTPSGVSRICKLIEKESPSILINCLGVERNGVFTKTTKKDYDFVMDTNVSCHFELTKKAIPHMVKNKWGRIIFITSVWGSVGTRHRAVYTMSKFALNGLAMSLADEYAKDGIRINCIAPGFINIDKTSPTGGRGRKRNRFLSQKIPVQKLGEPKDIGSTVKWLISEGGDYISGQIIVVDGGFLNSGSRGEPF